MTVGDRIRKLRPNLAISQVELAQKVGISKQTLYKYETNIVTNIPSDKIEQIAEILKTSPCYLMGWDEKKYSGATKNLIDVNSEPILSKIINCYDKMDDIGRNELADQAEYLLTKHHKSKLNSMVG